MEFNEYKCTLCKGEFKDPRLLECYHSFCRFCLDEYLMVNYDNGKFPCPLCKEYISVPANGARGLSKNMFAEQAGNSRKNNCDNCEHNVTADSICRDCNQYLCKICLINHISVQGSKTHNVISLGTNGGKETDPCSIHKHQELLFYCDTCEMPICSSCNMTQHRSHRSKDIDSMSAILKEQLRNSLQNLTTNTDMNCMQIKVADQQRQIRAYEEDLISAIDERTKELHRLVDEVRSEFVRKVISENSDNLKHLQEDQEKIDRSIAASQEMVKFGENFLEHSYNIDVVKHIPKIRRQIKKLQNTDIQLSEISQKVFYPLPANLTNLEIQKAFGSFEKRNKRPRQIKSISRLSELRRANSDGEQRMPKQVNSERRSLSDNSNSRKKPFSCSNGIVTSLSFLSDRSMCVCLGYDGIIEIFSQSGRRRQTQTFRHSIDDIVADKDDTLYISTNFDKKIFKIISGKKEIFAETRFCVRGLAIDEKGSLLATMTEKSSFFDAQKDGYITQISKDDKIKRIVDDSKIRYPARIAIGQDQRIFVSDWTQLCVMICKKDRVIGVYTGDNTREFTPRGICSLSGGDIIVVDISTNCLHWLSTDGKLRRGVPVDEDVELWSVAADKDDTVWVGTKDGRIIPIELF